MVNTGLPYSRQSSQGYTGCGLISQKDTVVLFCGCHNKLLLTRQLKTRVLYSLSVLEARIWNQGVSRIASSEGSEEYPFHDSDSSFSQLPAICGVLWQSLAGRRPPQTLLPLHIAFSVSAYFLFWLFKDTLIKFRVPLIQADFISILSLILSAKIIFPSDPNEHAF